MNPIVEKLESLIKAMEAGNYNAQPSKLVQGAALQIEELANVMHVVTYKEDSLKLQKMLKVDSCKSTLVQFDRQLSYGQFGGMAQFEGNVGQESTSDFIRAVVPMCFYSQTRRVTIASNMVATVDGKEAGDRAAQDAAKNIAGELEFECFRGLEAFSNAGVFDGNPSVVPRLPNMHGVDLQIRQSDSQRNSHDLMFSEYGSDDTVVISGGGVLTQANIEDASVRSAMNHGSADKLLVDPKVLSAYNKITYGKEKIILGGSPQDATGGDLRKQWVSGGTVSVEASRFLSGKTKAAAPRQNVNAPLAPASNSAAGSTDANAVSNFAAGNVFKYRTTAVNEVGESLPCAESSVTIAAAGDKVTLTITHAASGTWRYFNVYRTSAGGASGTDRFIGRVIAANATGGSTTTFTDLGNKLPGFVTGFLIEGDTMGLKELAPYSRLKMGISDLSVPEAHYRFCTLAMYEPRKNVIIDSLVGTF